MTGFGNMLTRLTLPWLFACVATFCHADPLMEIADKVLQETLLELPEGNTAPEPTRYNAWMYQNAIIMDGLRALGDVTANENYKTYKDRSIDVFARLQSEELGNREGVFSKMNRHYETPREMWHCGMIAALAERHQTNPTAEFERGMKIFDTFLENAPKFENGALVRDKGPELGLGLQIDDLYMITPYWCRKAALLDDPTWIDRAVDEALIYFDHLWDEESQLMYCLWLKDTQKPYGHFWGRGSGWYVMAVVDMLPFIPNDHPKREELLKDFRRFIEGIIAHQGDDGLWHQVINRPDSYSEASCTGMFTYCILKGVNEGWLAPSFLEAGKKGWNGLQTKVNDQNEITDVCMATDMSDDIHYYLDRPRKIHDQHGIGPFLLAGAEYLKAQEKMP
jgi:unsaturated rhamnogalacturonyl hydrolase